tara:strand:- start:154 stop:471 length:318 start_codon:yes stop_codon:yes gene_type:complete
MHTSFVEKLLVPIALMARVMKHDVVPIGRDGMVKELETPGVVSARMYELASRRGRKIIIVFVSSSPAAVIGSGSGTLSVLTSMTERCTGAFPISSCGNTHAIDAE